ncbi:aminopeptidase N [Prochlorococcus sp. MIT 1300]|uniref:aminopeptidase N n=1 Tax=Prochlorococcus sp. MIT 1300 TaxID=3096218 RepID=UPI002A7553C2|nr:aminopeptidase N [Prochlorococcus sp. MIT 1300]
MTKANSTRLSEYKPYLFKIPSIEIWLDIQETFVRVLSCLDVEPSTLDETPLVLKGVGLELESISINNEELPSDRYEMGVEQLIIKHRSIAPFQLKIVSKIDPFSNTTLEGMYLSGNIITTQCEAEGFRRIIFHPDRPDVLSKYKVCIEADRNRFPVLLSNGNQVAPMKILEGGQRHQAIWVDPFPKPSYLFAVVAGDLEKVEDAYFTASGRRVALNIYVEYGDALFTRHALDSLKRAMSWDEKVFGLEYDLDEYNIVAVRHFNMGAMENKSLNIFNSKLILADGEIATDEELEKIEAVIAHEYFHNWTGNRVTCRDWFQLSLKEGLTVFRDQFFTSDLHSEAVKRLQDVSLLRNIQFREDSGPTSHPVKPNSYQSIDNFYTTTIYEKGAELIRMMYILLGHDGFMKGMKIYFERFDGMAVTTEDFVRSMKDSASNQEIDFEKFNHWYYQPGTPKVRVESELDSTSHRLKITFHQDLDFPPSSNVREPLLIPVVYALIGNDGRIGEERTFILESCEDELFVDNIPSDSSIPRVSLFRGFSAPVKWETNMTTSDYFHLLKFDDDPFSRWNAGQKLKSMAILSRANSEINQSLEWELFEAFNSLICSFNEKDFLLLSTLLALPGLAELEGDQDQVDPLKIFYARNSFKMLLAKHLHAELKNLIEKSYPNLFDPWPNGNGQRKITALAWNWLASIGDPDVLSDALTAVNGPSMTLSKAALSALQQVESYERELAFQAFYDRWNKMPVILDTWFSFEASTPWKEGLQRVNQLLLHPRFDPTAPNSVRAVLGGLAANPVLFHALDGSGYIFMAEEIAKIDAINPITASRITKIFSRWRNYTSSQQKGMLSAIERLSQNNLSANTNEVLELIRA